MFKSIYFVFATAWGYYVLKDQFYMPKSLGGNGDFMDSFRGFPYEKHAP